MTHKFTLPAALICLIGAPCALAEAGDFDLRPSTYWSQFHIGVGAGYGAGNADLKVYDGTSKLTASGLGSSGWLASIEAGYDYQVGDSFVVGVQGDYTGSDISSHISISDSTGSASAKAKLDGSASALIRAGVLLDQNTLFYGLGGYTHSWWKAGGLKADRPGWTIGAGIEGMIASNASIKLEYRYTRSNSIDLLGPSAAPGVLAELTPETQTIRTVLSYRF